MKHNKLSCDVLPKSSWILLMTLLLVSSFSSAADYAKISVQEAHRLSTNEEILLIDIRSEQEWKQTGVAPQAHTISMHQEGGLLEFEQQLLMLLEFDKDKPIALICAAGVRSSRMQHYLHSRGFSQVSDVTEGMLGNFFHQGWIDQGLPIMNYKNSF